MSLPSPLLEQEEGENTNKASAYSAAVRAAFEKSNKAEFVKHSGETLWKLVNAELAASNEKIA